jgi:large conductance mechanosensitive channel
LREARVIGEATNVEKITIGYGKLLEASIYFLITSLIVFLIVKFINQLKSKADDVQDETVKTLKNIELLNKVSDLLEK